MSGSESAFWQFSLRLYGRPDVPAACLSLQDQQGIDVNLLFFILFLAINEQQISADDIRRIDACISDWRTRVVQPLRAVRRDLKGGIAPVNAAAAEALRSAIKRDELQAERLQQEILEREFPLGSIGSHATARIAAEANIAAYGLVAGALPAAPVNALLTALTEAFSLK
jgi:uncharacterized protein (TIGR02444 family)